MLNEINEIYQALTKKLTSIYLVGHYYNNILRVNINEIMYIARNKRGSKIFLNPDFITNDYEKKLICDETLTELYNLLHAYHFEYAHNSYIVNLHYIKRKTLTEIELLDHTVLTVSRSREKKLRYELLNYK